LKVAMDTRNQCFFKSYFVFKIKKIDIMFNWCISWIKT